MPLVFRKGYLPYSVFLLFSLRISVSVLLYSFFLYSADAAHSGKLRVKEPPQVKSLEQNESVRVSRMIACEELEKANFDTVVEVLCGLYENLAEFHDNVQRLYRNAKISIDKCRRYLEDVEKCTHKKEEILSVLKMRFGQCFFIMYSPEARSLRDCLGDMLARNFRASLEYAMVEVFLPWYEIQRGGSSKRAVDEHLEEPDIQNSLPCPKKEFVATEGKQSNKQDIITEEITVLDPPNHVSETEQSNSGNSKVANPLDESSKTPESEGHGLSTSPPQVVLEPAQEDAIIKMIIQAIEFDMGSKPIRMKELLKHSVPDIFRRIERMIAFIIIDHILSNKQSNDCSSENETSSPLSTGMAETEVQTKNETYGANIQEDIKEEEHGDDLFEV